MQWTGGNASTHGTLIARDAAAKFGVSPRQSMMIYKAMRYVVFGATQNCKYPAIVLSVVAAAVVVVSGGGCQPRQASVAEPIGSVPVSAGIPAPVLVDTRASASAVIGNSSVVESADPADEPVYTLVADELPADEVLFALARESHLRLDIIGRIPGTLTMSSIDEPLSRILSNVAAQLPVRLRRSATGYVLEPDLPVFRSYQVDYLNMQRTTTSSVDLTTQLDSAGVPGEARQSTGSNRSRMQIRNQSDNRFWQSLISGVAGIVGQQITVDPGSDRVGAEQLYVNRESGIIGVTATAAQHREIAAMIEDAVDSAQRQVLIEATVVEVTLSENFEAGVDWTILNENASGSVTGFAQLLNGSPAASAVRSPVAAVLSYQNPLSSIGNVSGTLSLLEQFGDVQVLSSPKIMALNNQPAVLKVVDNRVYFTFEIDRMSRDNGLERTLVESSVHSVPVGLVLNVVPFVTAADDVILNVRPSISRILSFSEDPSPALAGQAGVRNLIPEIQVREMESLLRVKSGEVAIIGGLMQNTVNERSAGIPGLRRIPLLGKAFSNDTQETTKTELLVFLRPTVLGDHNRPARLQQFEKLFPTNGDLLLNERQQ